MITTVSSNAGLSSALSSAGAGDTILLAPGTYSQISVYNTAFSGVTIASADPTRMAQVQGIVVNGVKGLTFSDLAVSVAADGTGVSAANSTNVAFDGLRVTGQGYLEGGLGFAIRTSSGISVTNSEVSQVWGGIDHLDSTGLTFSGNNLHDLRGDAIRGGGSSNMTITHNEISNIFPYDSHTDVIQFWGTAAHSTMSDITISENVYVRGTGGPIQGIFVTDGSYENMNIHDNAIVGGLWNGIVLNGVSNSVLEDNLVQAYADQGSYIGLGGTNNVQVLNNTTTGLLQQNNWGTSVNLTQQGNVTIQSGAVGDLSQLESWSATHLTGSSPSVPTEPPAGTSNADVIVGLADSANRLRGLDGDDRITGGLQFNDINGNAGADTVIGRSSIGDWLLGGQGSDQIDATASSGRNIVNGNLGDDRLLGGSGAETLRGGQGDDAIVGGAGDDWISGDRGSDTVTGGAGADVFHHWGGAGVSTITDFSRSEGDRLQFDPGTSYHLSQSGADVVVDLDGGARIVLQNVQASTLGDSWLI